MSKFKNSIFSIFLEANNTLFEYDRDDPHDNFWQAAKDYKANQYSNIQKGKLYSKPINPVQKEDQVFIKCITQAVNDNIDPQVMYLTGDKNQPYTFLERKAKRFSLSVANRFVEKHPRYTFKTQYDNREYERHYEIEKA